MRDELSAIADAFNIPIINNSKHIWFFRTQGGTYYFDYYINNYIALGWDKISVDFIQNGKMSYKAKREKVEELYPEEKRPGLILGQMDTFYHEMRANDLIIIPAISGRRIAIGVLGKITTSVKHAVTEEEYPKCEYKHMRSVKWFKEIDVWSDVYLFRVLRAQQTISDISNYADMVYRNLFSYYISENAVHLTLQKITTSDYLVADNVSLLSAILSINQTLADFYEIPNAPEKIRYKTAVGSPGFLEIILPNLPVSAITGVLITNALIGKTTTDDGKVVTGIMAVVSKANDLVTDHEIRKKIRAETAQIDAVTRKIDAETMAIYASIEKTKAETEAIKIANGKESLQLNAEKERVAIERIAKNSITLHEAAENSGIRYEGNIEDIG